MAAVCVACGAMKIGAWTPCSKCKHDATTDTGRARALLLSDRNLDAAGLAAASASIKAGEGVTYDEDKVREIAVGIATAPVPSRIGLIMVTVGFLLLVGAIGLMVVLVIRWLISLAA